MRARLRERDLLLLPSLSLPTISLPRLDERHPSCTVLYSVHTTYDQYLASPGSLAEPTQVACLRVHWDGCSVQSKEFWQRGEAWGMPLPGSSHVGSAGLVRLRSVFPPRPRLIATTRFPTVLETDIDAASQASCRALIQGPPTALLGRPRAFPPKLEALPTSLKLWFHAASADRLSRR
jgi:hypothetical protein